MRQVPPGLTSSRLVSDPEGHRPLDQDAELLVRVAVLGNLEVGLELEQRERQLVPVDAPADDSVPDLLGRDRVDVIEGAHTRRLAGPDRLEGARGGSPKSKFMQQAASYLKMTADVLAVLAPVWSSSSL